MCEFQDFLAYFHANGTCWLEFYLPKWKYSFFVTDSVGFVKLFLEKWLEKQEEYMGRTVYERLGGGGDCIQWDLIAKIDIRKFVPNVGLV